MAQREWGGTIFRRVGSIELLRNSDDSIAAFTPQERYAGRHRVPLHRYGAGPFCKFKVATDVFEGGVYALTSDRDVRYVGICQSLAARWGMSGYGSIQPRNCYEGGQRTNCKINALILQDVKAGRRLELWFAPLAVEQRPALEADLIATLEPPWNGRV